MDCGKCWTHSADDRSLSFETTHIRNIEITWRKMFSNIQDFTICQQRKTMYVNRSRHSCWLSNILNKRKPLFCFGISWQYGWSNNNVLANITGSSLVSRARKKSSLSCSTITTSYSNCLAFLNVDLISSGTVNIRHLVEIWQITVDCRVLYSSIQSNVQSVNGTELPVNRSPFLDSR